MRNNIRGALRNAAVAVSAFFGRFGDTKPRKQYEPQDIRGTHKFKKGEGDERFDEPIENDFYEENKFRELPPVYTFREWHNYFRQFRRRYWKGTGESKRPHHGKKLTRSIKREKVAAMKAYGHPRGDNRPVITVPAT